MTLADWRSLTDAYGPPLSAVEKPEHLRGWTRISDQSSQTGSQASHQRHAIHDVVRTHSAAGLDFCNISRSTANARARSGPAIDQKTQDMFPVEVELL